MEYESINNKQEHSIHADSAEFIRKDNMMNQYLYKGNLEADEEKANLKADRFKIVQRVIFKWKQTEFKTIKYKSCSYSGKFIFTVDQTGVFRRINMKGIEVL